jgi:hypothetical protein
MTRHKTARPATAKTVNGPRDSEQLRGRLDPTDKLKQSAPQVLPDAFGESDLAYFAARPHLDERVRLPFDFELPDEIVQAAVDEGMAGFIVVARGPPGAVRIGPRKFIFAFGGTA